MAGEGRGSGITGAGEALVFIGFVASGAAYIVWSKFAGLPAMAVTMVPVGVMLVYAAAILLVRPMRVGDDHGGDNLYYMGFLFTLTSLAVSLWQFDADGPAEDIVRNFGVAVASTIAGIALRIFMNQLRRDPGTLERSARVDLADAARRIRRELDATVLDLNHFRRGTQQAAAESWTAVRDEVSETARSVVRDLEAATEPVREAARRSGAEFDVLAARIAALSAALDGLSARLETLSVQRAVEAAPPASPRPARDRLEVVPGDLDGVDHDEDGRRRAAGEVRS
jgi:hypothetical protein